MKGTGSACGILLLMMVAVSSGRNARDYFEEARFQYSPSRPEDAVVFFIGNAPPLVCEPAEGDKCGGSDPVDADLCLQLRRSESPYSCTFERNSTTHIDPMFLQNSVSHLLDFIKASQSDFHTNKVYCTKNSQLPDEFFRLRIQRPHEEHPVKCLLPNDSGKLYLRFPGYPTIICRIDTDPFSNHFGRVYEFSVPGIADAPMKCQFRMYSELYLVDKHTDERLYKSLISELPSGKNKVRPRVVCSRRAGSSGPAHFELQLKSGTNYDCIFAGTVPRYLLQTTPSP